MTVRLRTPKRVLHLGWPACFVSISLLPQPLFLLFMFSFSFTFLLSHLLSQLFFRSCLGAVSPAGPAVRCGLGLPTVITLGWVRARCFESGGTHLNGLPLILGLWALTVPPLHTQGRGKQKRTGKQSCASSEHIRSLSDDMEQQECWSWLFWCCRKKTWGPPEMAFQMGLRLGFPLVSAKLYFDNCMCSIGPWQCEIQNVRLSEYVFYVRICMCVCVCLGLCMSVCVWDSVRVPPLLCHFERWLLSLGVTMALSAPVTCRGDVKCGISCTVAPAAAWWRKRAPEPGVNRRPIESSPHGTPGGRDSWTPSIHSTKSLHATVYTGCCCSATVLDKEGHTELYTYIARQC